MVEVRIKVIAEGETVEVETKLAPVVFCMMEKDGGVETRLVGRTNLQQMIKASSVSIGAALAELAEEEGKDIEAVQTAFIMMFTGAIKAAMIQKKTDNNRNADIVPGETDNR